MHNLHLNILTAQNDILTAPVELVSFAGTAKRLGTCVADTESLRKCESVSNARASDALPTVPVRKCRRTRNTKPSESSPETPTTPDQPL